MKTFKDELFSFSSEKQKQDEEKKTKFEKSKLNSVINEIKSKCIKHSKKGYDGIYYDNKYKTISKDIVEILRNDGLWVYLKEQDSKDSINIMWNR